MQTQKTIVKDPHFQETKAKDPKSVPLHINTIKPLQQNKKNKKNKKDKKKISKEKKME